MLDGQIASGRSLVLLVLFPLGVLAGGWLMLVHQQWFIVVDDGGQWSLNTMVNHDWLIIS